MNIIKKLMIISVMIMILSSFSLPMKVNAEYGIGEGPSIDGIRASTGQSLAQVVNEYGQIYLSLDALGILGTTGNIKVDKVEGATVRKAYLMSATTGFTNYRLEPGDVKLHNTDVVWEKEIQTSIQSYNYWADVTGIVKPFIDSSPPGLIEIKITERNSSLIDGEILAVIFDDPSQARSNSVLLFFGSQNIAGDTFKIDFGSPIDKSDSNLSIDLSLGISYGYQTTTVTDQYSIVDVNGQRLTTSAGGQDDGENANGALITVGGIGDQNSNPLYPYSLPVDGARSDDELYDLLPYIKDGDSSVTIYTKNPSADDNIMFAGLTLGATRNVDAIDIDISLYKSLPSTEERAIYQNIINYFADGVYEASNGAHKLGRVTFHSDGTYVSKADILWIEKCHPKANIVGIAVDGLNVTMCDLFENGGFLGLSDLDFLKNDTNQKKAGYVLAHEWGHYYYGLYDEYAQDNSEFYQPHKDDQPVHHSIMNNQMKAITLLGGNDYHWLNFSISKNFTEKNAQNRVYQASAWETLTRPASQDPRDGERLSLPERIYYPELNEVKPIDNQDSPIVLPGDARSALLVSWRLGPIIAADSSVVRSTISLEPQLTSLLGNNISYPTPILLIAFVHNDLKVTDMIVEGHVHTPDGSKLTINFKDDGVAPDAVKGDGIYSAILSPEENGVYSIQANFNNDSGTAKYTYTSFLPAQGEDGPVPFPEPATIDENFSLSKTIWVSVSNVVSDDFGNTPSDATYVIANNKPISGKIDYAGDKDVFKVTTLIDGTTYVRITNLALGMNPNIRVIASDKTTVLFQTSLENSLGKYLYLPLNNVVPNTTVFIEVADASSLSKGGLYDFSAGSRISSDVPIHSIFLPTILR